LWSTVSGVCGRRPGEQYTTCMRMPAMVDKCRHSRGIKTAPDQHQDGFEISSTHPQKRAQPPLDPPPHATSQATSPTARTGHHPATCGPARSPARSPTNRHPAPDTHLAAAPLGTRSTSWSDLAGPGRPDDPGRGSGSACYRPCPGHRPATGRDPDSPAESRCWGRPGGGGSINRRERGRGKGTPGCGRHSDSGSCRLVCRRPRLYIDS